MCGRYTITQDLAELEKLVRFSCKVVDFKPRYNLAPSQVAVIIRADPSGNRTFLNALWGLIPTGARVTEDLSRPVNAKAETAAIEPRFRNAFRQRRILVPADAFYEWKKIDGQKQPFLIHMKDGAPLASRGCSSSGRDPRAKWQHLQS